MDILLVDDDVEILTGLGRGLRAAGHSVATARDGLAGLDAALATPPQVILADVMMPGLNGFQLCRRLRADPRTAAVPILLMSGKVDPVDHYWAGEVGARALIPKPLATPDVLASIEAAARPPAPPGAGAPGDPGRIR
jgi:DNA-binding response OmpR family regulator